MHEPQIAQGISDVKKSGMSVVSSGILASRCSGRNASCIFYGFAGSQNNKTLSAHFKVVSFWSHIKLESHPVFFFFLLIQIFSYLPLPYSPPAPLPPYSHMHKYIDIPVHTYVRAIALLFGGRWVYVHDLCLLRVLSCFIV